MTDPGQPYRLVIFDFDGTLADSFPWFMSVLNQVALRWRFRTVMPEEEPLLRSMSARAILRHLRVPGWKVPLVARDLRRRMARDIDQIRPFAGVDAMLRQLHDAGVELGIATSNDAGNVRHVLGRENLRLVRHMQTGASVFGKGARLRRVLRVSGVPAARTAYIGDEVRDVEAARAAGVAAVVVTWGYNSAEVLKRTGADLVCSDIGELIRVLALPNDSG